MKLVEKTEQFVIGSGELSINDIGNAVNKFISITGKKPETMRVSPYVKTEMVIRFPQDINPIAKKFMGMELEEDPTYERHEWRVGTSHEIVRVMR